MPVEYPITQLLSDMMAVITDGYLYIIPAAILAGAVAFVTRWFMYAVNIGDWTFGGRR